ncbi:hypothetical protein PPL_01896 [Heterostelium album PN500]|uniref:Uncharacterized protein n=1 Tax=Heterostelium pallidum (strain ATCC 26659 / Pp 5 / PN500) TaxID=670386 RepID=D3B0S9_HETP5|nr:hypothetical protein PPL_01896 [Heterostelium album PN500]EFA84903.1 hypothetical protein PPL_01896 [Heterostelium album PN500]|eukprot:XP_020437013.1 hypothetical protein PPL_01896 [Heterostelium album PN500]
MSASTFDEVPIDLSKLFPNIESLKLNHIYHRLARATKTGPLFEPKSILSRLTEFRHLSITNEEKTTNNQQTNRSFLTEYLTENSTTSTVFKLDIASIGHRLETIKIIGEVSLFNQLFSVIEQLVCLKRLSIPSKELSLSNLKLLLQSTSLVHLTTLLKICDYAKKEGEESLLLNLLEVSSGFQDIRFICYKTTLQQQIINNFTLLNNVTVSFINECKHKQPKQTTKPLSTCTDDGTTTIVSFD